MTSGLKQRPAVDPAALFAAGNAALAAGDARTAVQQYKLALTVAPGVAELHNNLASALLALDEVDEAVAVAERGCETAPPLAALHNTLANACLRAGRNDDAAQHYRRALALDPGLASAAVNLADLHRRRGDSDAAAALTDELLARDPRDREALKLRALLAMQAGRTGAAAEILQALLADDGDDVATANNLAICFLNDGRPHDALRLYRDLLARHPDLADAHGNLAQTLQGLGRHDEAVPAFRRALELDPEQRALLPFLMQSLMHQCDWPALKPVMDEVLALASAGNGSSAPPVSPFALAATTAPPALRLSAARRYTARCIAAAPPAAPADAFAYRQAGADGLRIGYISPDFRQHSVATSFLPLLQAHSRRGYRWCTFWIGREPEDEVTAAIAAASDQFVDLRGQDPAAAARTVNAAGIDVLVDLAGHTRDSALEILALKPAPVQAHYLGYGGTLGADCIPYLITDHVHTPPALQAHTSEAPVFLPGSFMAAARPEVPHAQVSRHDEGLPEEGTVFACFNAPYKLDADSFALWMRLLEAVPHSVLWLRRGSAVASANLQRAAARHGIAGDRLVFAPRVPHQQHLLRHGLADLALDTRWHTGGVTTLDALWAGVPVITMAGDSHAGRTGASILAAAGLADLVAASPEAYLALALDLVGNRTRLARLRARVAEGWEAAPLYDVRGLAAHLEVAYAAMHARWRAGGVPAPIDVAAVLASSC